VSCSGGKEHPFFKAHLWTPSPPAASGADPASVRRLRLQWLRVQEAFTQAESEALAPRAAEMRAVAQRGEGGGIAHVAMELRCAPSARGRGRSCGGGASEGRGQGGCAQRRLVWRACDCARVSVGIERCVAHDCPDP
jgi:hypothetical protein